MKMTTLTLESTDVFQILDALEAKAESWERTAKWLHEQESSNVVSEAVESVEDSQGWETAWENENLQVNEECSNPLEAESIAKHYRDIIASISHQMES